MQKLISQKRKCIQKSLPVAEARQSVEKMKRIQLIFLKILFRLCMSKEN